MDKCPIHGTEWRVIPAGVSKKTGKPYGEFKVCEDRDCKEKPAVRENLPTVGNEEVMDAMRKLYIKVDRIGKEVKNINALVAGAMVAREEIPQIEQGSNQLKSYFAGFLF